MESKPGDQRLGQLIEQLSLDDVTDAKVEELKTGRKVKVGIIGVPCDEGLGIEQLLEFLHCFFLLNKTGVKRNKGRPGAKDGPAAFRKMLARTGSAQNPEYDIDIKSRVKVYDLGDVTVPDFSAPLTASDPDPLVTMHTELKAKVKWALEHKIIPFVVGGGNDQSYAVGAALLEFVKENKKSLGGKDSVGVVNIDAHLDVRPLLDSVDDEGKSMQLRHSGCPFRLLIEDPLFTGEGDDSRKDDGNQFVEYGAQGNQCSMEHAQFVKNHNGRIIWLNELRGGIAPMSLALSRFRSVLDSFGLRSNIFVSFDIDSIRSADCPGVSCPSPIGLTSEEALSLCLESGRRDNVCVFDTSEFNPTIECDRTSRLLANMFYYFCLGLAQRL